MRGTKNLDPGNFAEDNTYDTLNVTNNEKRMKGAKAAGSTQYRVIVALGILLILAFLIVTILTILIFINNKRLSGIESHMENNGSLSSDFQSMLGTVRKLEDILSANNSNVMSKVTEIESSLKLISTDKAAGSLSSDFQNMLGTVRKLEDIMRANNSNMMSKVTEIESSLKLILTDKAAGSLSSDFQSMLGTVRKLEDIMRANNSNVMSKVTEIESSLKLILTDKAAEKINEACTSCPNGWQLIKSNCYYFQENGETWEQSVVQCAKLNSALLILKNRAELDSLLPIIAKQRFWLGLRRNSKDLNSFLWNDGSRLTFSDWSAGEPNNDKGNEHCVEILGDLKAMNDQSCDTKTGYICKRLLTC